MAETSEKDDAPWWIRVAERFGLPTLILAVVTFFAREVAVALHTDVIVPVVQSHTKFLERTGTAIERQTESIEAIGVTQSEIKQVLDIFVKREKT